MDGAQRQRHQPGHAQHQRDGRDHHPEPPRAAEGQPPSPAASASRGTAAPATAPPPITGVINHVSWGVQPWDTEKVKAELEKRGLNPRPDMVGDNFKSWHVKDPDGWDLQISNQTKDSRD
jgi:hypothetical protein